MEELPSGALMRKPYLPYVEILHRWQVRLSRPTRLDADPFDKAVDLADVRRAAEQFTGQADADWH